MSLRGSEHGSNKRAEVWKDVRGVSGRGQDWAREVSGQAAA